MNKAPATANTRLILEIVLLVFLPFCLSAAVIDTGCGPWNLTPTPMPVIPMDNVTVYAFSQVPTDSSDQQVLDLMPDISIRSWAHWDRYGIQPADYNFGYTAACKAANILFIGGNTATVLFADELSPADYNAIVTRDASGAIVNHDNIQAGAHRGSIANPVYRAYIESICRIQIDGGVDGMFFDEVDHDYDGAAYDNNEGFDDYHIADFNGYLLMKYPAGKDFGSGNVLSTGFPAGDLVNNFNYRNYLASNGWTATPFAAANPLANVWGRSYDDHPEPGCATFVSAAEPYRYFAQMVQDLKTYAWNTYGRKLLITANGLLPNVDFQSVGLWDYNNDGDGGAMADYVPVSGGHLNGSVSLQSVFKRFKARSEELAPGAPVVLFQDWPTNNMNRYTSLPAAERQDYWRLYAAEAYANGLFFAFHLSTTTGEPTATQQGMMGFFKSYSAFYRSHASLYHNNSLSAAAVTVSQSNINTSVWTQSQKLLVHLVNHNYNQGFQAKDNVAVTVAMPFAPGSVSEASPDLAADIPLDFSYASGVITVTIPKLTAYSVLIIGSAPGPRASLKQVMAYPSPCRSCGEIKFANLTKHTDLKIYDLTGALVYSRNTDTPEGSLTWVLNPGPRSGQITPGVYIYTVIDENKEIFTGKTAVVR